MKPVHIVLGLILGWGAPAAADNDYERGDEKHEHRDCHRARGHCEDNDASPSFQDSPVDRSFNPQVTVCLPLSSCDFDDDDAALEPEPDEPQQDTDDTQVEQLHHGQVLRQDQARG